MTLLLSVKWQKPSAFGCFLTSVFLSLCLSNLSIAAPALPEVPDAEPPTLTSIDDQRILWQRDGKLRVYAFLGCDCPVAKLYARRLEELQSRFSSRGVQWIGVISNPQDSIQDIRDFAKELDVTFPFIQDADQAFAQSWKITRTAEVILVNPRNEILYRGRIDDQYAPGITRSKTTREDLALAIESALAGSTPEISVTEPVGCKIAYLRKTNPLDNPPTPTVTYADSVAAIFDKHCTECHRPGEIGPFDITNTAELPGWSEMILETIDTGRMPPWHADPAHGSFKNSRSISREEIEIVRQWVRGGAAIGDVSKLTPATFTASGWRLGKEPDLVVPMSTQPYRIPGSGTVDYQYFVVDPKLTEDRWVASAQVIPGEPSVVHHAIVFIRPPDDSEFIGVGWLTAYVPGQMATHFPIGYARKIPAGSKLVFQMHYTPNGRPTSDLSKIGLTFVDEPTVTHEVFTVVGLDQDFEIPPRASNHSVTAKVSRFPKNGELLAVSPHMHVRGKAFELRARRKDATEVLLSVPHYDFNWQHTYEWTERIPLADIEGLEFTATFDNSDANPTNPAPDEFVMWGDQTWEEMALAFFEVSRPLNDSSQLQQRSIAQRSDRPAGQMKLPADSQEDAATKYADQYIAKWDSNKDGIVSWEESPRILRDFGFFRIDRNNDRQISREELIQAGQRRGGQ